MADEQPGQQPKQQAMSIEPVPVPRINLVGANLRGTSMAGQNLEHADMRAADVRGVDFTGSSLRYADLRGTLADGANFQKASLYGAKMQGIEAFGANFRQADLRQANLAGAYLDAALTPPPERRPSAGEIAEAKEPQAKPWEERETTRSEQANRDSNGGTGQNDRARGDVLPNVQRQNEQGRGR
jgi:uncharacterized protein YjbI with pentapeptide repeats